MKKLTNKQKQFLHYIYFEVKDKSWSCEDSWFFRSKYATFRFCEILSDYFEFKENRYCLKEKFFEKEVLNKSFAYLSIKNNIVVKKEKKKKKERIKKVKEIKVLNSLKKIKELKKVFTTGPSFRILCILEFFKQNPSANLLDCCKEFPFISITKIREVVKGVDKGYGFKDFRDNLKFDRISVKVNESYEFLHNVEKQFKGALDKNVLFPTSLKKIEIIKFIKKYSYYGLTYKDLYRYFSSTTLVKETIDNYLNDKESFFSVYQRFIKMESVPLIVEEVKKQHYVTKKGLEYKLRKRYLIRDVRYNEMKRFSSFLIEREGLEKHIIGGSNYVNYEFLNYLKRLHEEGMKVDDIAKKINKSYGVNWNKHNIYNYFWNFLNYFPRGERVDSELLIKNDFDNCDIAKIQEETLKEKGVYLGVNKINRFKKFNK